MIAAEDVTRIIEAAVVRPGDVLVISVDQVVTRMQLDEVADHIKAKLPESMKVLVLGGQIRIHVLRAGEVAE